MIRSRSASVTDTFSRLRRGAEPSISVKSRSSVHLAEARVRLAEQGPTLSLRANKAG